MDLLIVVIVGFAVLCWAVADYRAGIVLTLMAGFAADPLRKVTISRSPYWVGVGLILFTVTFLGALRKRHPLWWRRVEWLDVGRPAKAVTVLLLVEAIYTFTRGYPIFLVGVGLASYAGPVAALVLGSWAGSDPRRVHRILWLYIGLVLVMASGIWLASLGYDWNVLSTVGVDLIVYDLKRGKVVLPSGFFRTPEVASWHCATAACLAIIVAVCRKANVIRYVLTGAAAAFLSWSVLQAGRRKGLGEVVVFFALYVFLLVWVRRQVGRLGGAILAGILLASLFLQGGVLTDKAEAQIASMKDRNRMEGRPFQRVLTNVTNLPDVVRFNGVWGRGLGTLSQGGTYFGADMGWGVISEGGLARIVGELGVVGSGLILFLGFRFLRAGFRRVGALRLAPPAMASQTLGLMALLGANGVVFIAAHQIFGDPFVYILLGLVAGCVTSAVDRADLAHREMKT